MLLSCVHLCNDQSYLVCNMIKLLWSHLPRQDHTPLQVKGGPEMLHVIPDTSWQCRGHSKRSVKADLVLLLACIKPD